jgi:putative transposase
MSGVSFVSGSKILLNNTEYLIRKPLNSDDYEVQNLAYKNIEVWSRKDLLKCWKEGNLFLNIKSNNQLNVKVLEDFSEEQVKVAKRRYEILKPVIEGEILAREIKEYLKTLNGEVGLTQFYDWKKRWEKSNDIRSLIANRRGPQNKRTSDEVIKIIDEIINELFGEGEKFTVDDVYSEHLIRIDEINEFRSNNKLKPVSKSTINRRKQAIFDEYKRNIIKFGPVQAKLIRDGSKEEVNVSRPLQRVEIDWTTVDVMLIDPSDLKPKRPNLVYALDKYSGYPLGFYVTFGGVDSNALKQCLLHSIMPKTYLKELYPEVESTWDAYGIPSSIILDNASVNESRDIEDACLQLGIQDVQFCTVGAGHQKGSVERQFRSLNTKFIHTLRGTTFSNFVEKGLYDSQGKACITLQGFIYMAHIAMVDLVANQYNSRLGFTPSEKWNTALKNTNHQLVKLPRNILELKILLMGGTSIRKITNKGIAIKNEYFQSYELMLLKSQLEKDKASLDVRVRYDLSDMREIYIFDSNKNTYIKAEPTGFVRKKIDTTYPVPYELLCLDSSKRLNESKKVDPKLRGRAKRNIKKIEKLEMKKVKKLKSDNIKNKQEPVKDYVNFILDANLEADVNIPHNNDDITILEPVDEKVVKLEKNMIKEIEAEIIEHDIEVDEFEDWEVKYIK